MPMSSIEMQFYLQDWFLQLFQCRNNGYLELSESLPPLNQIILLTGIDIILTYCHEIAKLSENPGQATDAVYKALAIIIASEQMDSHADLSKHLYDMMLLD
jgi:hypothetical protein